MEEQRKIKRKEYQVIIKELETLEKEGKISSIQFQNIKNSYNIENNINFLKVLLIIGGLLLGLGVIIFISSNWDKISKLKKLIMILAVILGFNLTGYKYLEKNKILSKAMFLGGALSYGGGIFLVSQIFNLSIEANYIFLYWILGVIGLALYLNDNLLYSLVQVICFFYIMFSLENDLFLGYPFIMLLFQLFLIICNNLKMKSKVLEIFNTLHFYLLSYFLLYKMFSKIEKLLNTDDYIILLFLLFSFFIISFVIPLIKNNEDLSKVRKKISKVVNYITAFILTFPSVWSVVIKSKFDVTIIDFAPYIWVFVILFIGYLIYKISKGSLSAIIFLTIIIFRYFFDFNYDFLPKSFVFILGGFVFIGMGLLIGDFKKKGILKNE